MRSFDFEKEYSKLLTPDIVSYITQIHEYRGRYSADNVQKELLSELLEIARIQSTEASNRIEGIITTDDRLKKIVREKTLPKTRSEKEIAGYRDVLATIHENYEYIPVSSNMILQLHRDLYKFSGNGYGGNYKSVDNVIAEELPDGTKRVRFQPVPAWETAETVNDLCNAFKDAVNKQFMDILLLFPMFILDFLCIHPFNDGNGRTGRMIMFRESLKNPDILPFIVLDENRSQYIDGLKQYREEQKVRKLVSLMQKEAEEYYQQCKYFMG